MYVRIIKLFISVDCKRGQAQEMSARFSRCRPISSVMSQHTIVLPLEHTIPIIARSLTHWLTAVNTSRTAMSAMTITLHSNDEHFHGCEVFMHFLFI